MSEGSFQADQFVLQFGPRLPSVWLAYKTHGTLNARRDNAILFPTWFGVNHLVPEWIIGPGRALDPSKYFIIVVNILGNGTSSSPSNMPAPFAGPAFPHTSLLDNVLLQHRAVTELWRIERFAAIVGRSMGAQVAFQWASYFPEMVPRMLALCGSAKTSAHNVIFLETIKKAIQLDPAFKGGAYDEQPQGGLALMRTIYDSWVLSQTYYRRGLHLTDRFPTTRAYLDRPIEGAQRDANDVLQQISTWQNADISNNDRFAGSFLAALQAIEARTIVMPSRSDLYFPAEDSANEVVHIKRGELRAIESCWGHRAGAPGGDPADTNFIEQGISDLLADFSAR